GFLLALEDGAGRLLLGTDDSWRRFHRDHPFLLRGLLPLSPTLALGPGEEVLSWGLPPMGRWGVPAPGPARPLYQDLVGGPPPPPPPPSPPPIRRPPPARPSRAPSPPSGGRSPAISPWTWSPPPASRPACSTPGRSARRTSQRPVRTGR